MTQIPFRIVGFDLDGTLLDTSKDLGAAVNHALSLIGRPPVPDEAVSGLIGGGSRLMLRRALALTGGDEGLDVEALYAPLLAFYEDNIAVHTALYPGGAAMLDALDDAGVAIAMVTNKPQPLAEKLLGELGLMQRFACVIGGGGGFPLKPAPDALHAMVERAGGGAAAYVGDTTFDTGAARAAGLPCVAVSFGFNDLPVHDLGADAMIDHFDALIPALRRL
ncbi:HAD-IA family hydrolase [Novosphingobium arvoryzae]|uniref:phosphoglycolate phosphatase n=1 Tax=Novosphingobium arvoryzae TaxID=1256514 RepID=A0A918VE52_9SPHN|nr:HAD-IA family hydrolase [Novosphingobium arvoryzae]GGZ91407.1 phosphoglycolate phosphatase, bacterial [Novosphingobium arvoryzae]